MMKNLNYVKYLQQFIVLSLLALLSTQVLAGKRTTTYMHTDALGSVVAASDKDGKLLWRKQYMPFGSEINRDPNLKELSYTGKKFDAELGLSYSGARYYDPSLGRFGGIDPATALENVEPNPMMFNRYAYANNNPYRYVDPDGEQSIEIIERYFMGGKEQDEPISNTDSAGWKMFEEVSIATGEQAGPAALKAIEYGTMMSPVGMVRKAAVTKGANLAKKGVIDEGANFAQKTFRKTFSKGGKFAGQTVDDVAGQLKAGILKASDVPIEFFTRKGGQTLIANTRSAQALTRAGIPRSQWYGVNISGDAAALRRLAGQLKRNKLPKTGTPIVRQSGGG